MSITVEEKKLIGKAIAAKRTRAGQSLVEFGRALGMSASAICQFESGKDLPSTNTLMKMRRVYGLDPLASITQPAKKAGERYRLETHFEMQPVKKLIRIDDETAGVDHLNQLKSQPVSPQVDEKDTASHAHARENDILTQHEKHMQGIADNSGSMIEDAIELHRMLVEEDSKLYSADGKPLADKAVTDASWRREVKAFRILARMKCRSSEEAQAKLAYFLRPAASDEYSNMERLVLDAYVDEHAKGSGISDLTDDFLQSLLVERV